MNELKKFQNKKSVIGSFTTHDEVSPIIIKGQALSDMIIWLNATLPINSYFVDGFQSGDDYMYLMGNKIAPETNTDDEIYFAHRGKIDIFNYSRKPGGNNIYLKENFILGNDVKKSLLPILNNGIFTPIKTGNPQVFAYTVGNIEKKVLVYGNLNFGENEKAIIKIPKLKNDKVIPLKVSQVPNIKNKKIQANLAPGEIVVIILNN